ncbi:SH3 domain-containing protein [Treponema putidum]|uniref:SH3 domain-containing protein n=1 Tax=Treponema putidum TaxID=221027 RepID=UPI0004F7DA9C|nr:SH3 domain-containing protein [Treponema putidum]AIN93018.1 hypothetical protein JO40_01845 [Treponema putidum]TWI78491.1 SH3 domain-containing protein [Treponema putidum]UTY31758.1 SH3 domain-containing protein [Treponema putidum]
MKNLIFYFLFIASTIGLCAQKYIAIITDDDINSIHYVIDNKVNVRAEPSLSGEKLFQLNLGDAVRILRSNKDWDWILEEGYYSPWYRIVCEKGEGYMCGRYISCKEAVGDIDNDGEDEIFACLCITEQEGVGVSEYKESFYNVDKNHILIKKSSTKPIPLENFSKYEVSEDASYSIKVCENLIPKVSFLIMRCGFSDGGIGWSSESYYYFLNGSLRYFDGLHNEFFYMESETEEEFEFNGDRVKLIRTVTKWENEKPLEPEITVTQYLWDGEDFIKTDK